MNLLCGKKICVTGASGFLGRHLLPVLEESGAEITCIVRQSSDVTGLRGQIKKVDFHDSNSLKKALRGQEILVHLAAVLFGYNYQDYLSENSLIAFNLAQAAKNLERVLHVSSLAAAGPEKNLPGKKENATPAPVSAYGWSKLLSESILQKELDSRVVIVRPPIIYGSGDKGMLPVFRGISRGFAAVPGKSFPVSLIHVKDAARAILNCLHPQADGIYHVSDGHPIEMSEFYRKASVALGRKKPVRIFNLPLPIMKVSAHVCGFLGKLGKSPTSRPPEWNPDKFREAGAGGWVCDDSRIHRELGFLPHITLEAGLHETIEGYRKQGQL